VDTRKVLRKILFVTMWVMISGGVLTLLIAAVGKQKRNTCKDYVISIKGNDESLFLSIEEVLKTLKTAANGNIKGQSKKSFNLLRLENLLKENQWVKDAQLYFDNKDILHVSVTERKPIARIFTAGGKSFYIDDEAQKMKLSVKRTAVLPVFTGYPDKTLKIKEDSILMNNIKITAQLINTDSFWTAQVAQIDVTPSESDQSWEFEMIPVVGNHIIKLGNGQNIAQKFNRLFIFYKEVLSRTGFNKYKTIDVRYAGQVIGGKSENPKVDSVLLRKSVEKMLEQIKIMETEAMQATAVPDSVAVRSPLPGGKAESINTALQNKDHSR
jgi:cell division protein FtsQ